MTDGRRLEGRTAAQWIRRWMGQRPHEVVWEPLLRAKFGGAAEEIALPWFWSRAWVGFRYAPWVRRMTKMIPVILKSPFLPRRSN